MHALDQYRGTVVACRYSPPSSLVRPEALETLKARFYNAVARVALAQPHLQIGVTGENSKSPVFIRLGHLDLQNHFEWRSIGDSSDLEAQYLELMQAQLDSRYDHLSTKPGWKVVILHIAGVQSLEVLYSWNHLHHDGMSAKIFHEQLLRNLNEAVMQTEEPPFKVTKGVDSLVIDLPDPSDKLPPNPELLSSWPMTPAFIVKALWMELRPPLIFPPGNTHAHWAPIRTAPFTTRFRTFTVDNDTVTKVVGACRSHQTTLTGLMHALVLVSLISDLRDMKGFASRTPYDLRHILPSNPPLYPWLQPRESMCNYVSVIDHGFDAELVSTIRSKLPAQPMDTALPVDFMDIIWDVSVRVRREIQARLDSGLWNDMIGIMKLASDWQAQQKGEAQKARHLSWLVTNLGVLDGGVANTQSGHEEAWRLRRGEMVLSTEVPSAAISVSILTVKGEKMCVTCSWQDCVVDQDMGERLIGNLERWLNDIGA